MKAKIFKGQPKGSVTAPPSKSYAHRELIAGMLSGGSKVSHLSYSEDVLATLDCANSLGAIFTREDEAVAFDGFKEIKGTPELDCRESGSTLRFFLPIALTKCSSFTMKGSSRLIERGIKAYEDCLRPHGIAFAYEAGKIEVKGKLKSGLFNLDVSSSSQYVSGLLFALPLLDGDSHIVFLNQPTSTAYIDMTVDTLKTFGITVKKEEKGYFIPGSQHYQKIDVAVEGDDSNAAFLAAFAELGAPLEIKGLNPSSLQADRVYQDDFPILKKGHATIDVDSCIDLSPVLFAFAALNHGGTFTGISRLAIKESNRAEAMKEELEKAGVSVKLSQNQADIEPSKKLPSHLCFDSHHDHRIAMALSLFSLYADIEIEDADCVKKSYPDYFDVLSSLGMEVETHE